MSWFGPIRHRFRKRPATGMRPADQVIVRQIREQAASLINRSDRELRDLTDQLRERVFTGMAPEDASIVIPGFALMNEAIRRTLGLTYYDVQLLAGLALARGAIAEMHTGEGKTLVAALPALVRGLTGRGVHVATANSYLAARDCDQLAPAFECLGITARLLPERAEPSRKQAAYQADVTYGPGYEFGFDYLRDQVTLRHSARAPLGQSVLNKLSGQDEAQRFLQRGLAFALIDEIDSVLIDDAGSPLMLSDQDPGLADDAVVHRLARELLPTLQPDLHYVAHSNDDGIQLTESGLQLLHADAEAIPFKWLKRPWAEYLRQALRAERLFRRDVHYVVAGERIQIVDESTGRIFEDRHWREGLHQAIEAKEGVPITAEKSPLAQIARQRFFRLYEKLGGMTGTASGSEAEFATFYHLAVVPIPLRKPCRRIVHPPRYFADHQAKWRAVAEIVRERQEQGQPVLVGTRTIAASEQLAARLTRAGIVHQVLNGRQDADEANVIARAGQVGQVTIATNMAGRGTDIRPSANALAAGGLCVLGTERHDSSRIDRQLVGRGARQGEPGSAQFLLSADDALILQQQPGLARLMKKSAKAQGEVHFNVTPFIDRVQQHLERRHYQQRRELSRGDDYRDEVLGRLHHS